MARTVIFAINRGGCNYPMVSIPFTCVVQCGIVPSDIKMGLTALLRLSSPTLRTPSQSFVRLALSGEETTVHHSARETNVCPFVDVGARTWRDPCQSRRWQCRPARSSSVLACTTLSRSSLLSFRVFSPSSSSLLNVAEHCLSP
jgi:hypothetical protein